MSEPKLTSYQHDSGIWSIEHDTDNLSLPRTYNAVPLKHTEDVIQYLPDSTLSVKPGETAWKVTAPGMKMMVEQVKGRSLAASGYDSGALYVLIRVGFEPKAVLERVVTEDILYRMSKGTDSQ